VRTSLKLIVMAIVAPALCLARAAAADEPAATDAASEKANAAKDSEA
jgi:hypothetical protein